MYSNNIVIYLSNMTIVTLCLKNSYQNSAEIAILCGLIMTDKDAILMSDGHNFLMSDGHSLVLRNL